MKLSDELFEQVVTSLAAGDAKTLPNVTLANGEQRRAARFVPGAGTTVRLIPLTDSFAPGPIDVALRDVSLGGAGFLYHGRIPLDEQFVLVLPSTEGQVAVLCGVAYWQPVAKEMFAIGAKFRRVLRQGSAHYAARAAAVAPVRKAV